MYLTSNLFAKLKTVSCNSSIPQGATSYTDFKNILVLLITYHRATGIYSVIKEIGSVIRDILGVRIKHSSILQLISVEATQPKYNCFNY